MIYGVLRNIIKCIHMHNLKIFVTLNKIFWKGGGCWWLYFKNLCSSYSIPLYSWLAVLWRVIYGDFHCPTLYKWTFSGSESILFQHIDPICSHSWWMISVCKEEVFLRWNDKKPRSHPTLSLSLFNDELLCLLSCCS